MKLFRMLIKWYLFLVPFSANAQIYDTHFGAETEGMGGAVTSNYSTDALFNNIAGISQNDQISLISSLQSRFSGIFNTVGFGINCPTSFGNFGFTVARFGDKLYNEQQVSIGYAYELAGVSFGLRAKLWQVNAQNQGTLFVPIFDFGVITQLSKQIWLGGAVNNLTQSGFQTETNTERLPARIAIGISYLPQAKVKFNIDIVKAILFPVSIHTGIQYALTEKLLVRTGLSSLARNYHFGASLKLKKITCDYAFSTHPHLGTSHQLTLATQFKTLNKKKKVFKSE
ncbi:MAG: hypothetical protein AAGI07_13080 [Bacteroidota bacterium]